MRKFVLSLVVSCLAVSTISPASAQMVGDAFHNVQASGITKQADGKLRLTLIETSVQGSNMSMLQYQLENLSCQSLSGRLVSVIGNVGVQTVVKQPNQVVFFKDGDLFDQVVWQICGIN